MKLIVCHNMRILVLLSAMVMLLSACSNDDTNSPADTSKDAPEIRINASVSTMAEGTRATLFTTGTMTSGSFCAAAYVAESTTPYVNATTVNWVTDHWEFSDGKHYWPASGSLDFFAYMPESVPSYIKSGPTYTTARSPQFVCEGLPMKYDSSTPAADQGTGLQEFVYALVVDQDKAGTNSSVQPTAGQVALSFKHPFARIKFQLAPNHPDIKINSITFKELKTGGTCTFNGTASTWSSLTPEDKTSDFVMTLTGDAAVFNSNPAAASVPIGSYSGSAHQSVDILMVPQTFAGNITVNATWIDWGEEFAHNVSTKLDAVNWQAGYSYTYTFTISETDLRVDTDKFAEQW